MSDENHQDLTNQKRRSLPETKEFKDFMLSNWEKVPAFKFQIPQVNPEIFADRRKKLYQKFVAENSQASKPILIIPAGIYHTRSNDCAFKFRPYSAFSYYTGLGQDFEPKAILVIESENKSTLFVPSPKDFSTTEFYEHSLLGAFWIGNRPSNQDFQDYTGIETQDLVKFSDNFLPNHLNEGKNSPQIVFIPGVDHELDQLLEKNTPEDKVLNKSANKSLNKSLETLASEQRMIKDEYEINELKKAIEYTKLGFDNVIRNIDEIKNSNIGERVIEAKFHEVAITKGNLEGYDTIAASGTNATTLHWTRNNKKVNPDLLVLLDAGVEVDTLYTADITRTFPVNGKFTKDQLAIYNVVLKTADEVFKIAKPGVKFSELNKTAFKFIREGLHELGILPVKNKDWDSDQLDDEGGFYRRWMSHAVSHHLGLDVHDCASARFNNYYDQELQPGFVFTIEPGLYFQENDLLVPEKFRGIGVRIEDNVVITENGCENLSAFIPRTPLAIEAWIKELT